MASGTAVNLVSRCSSVDEFVAAFRTYVHRDHVFVPTTGQLPTGRRARIAITLADGTPVIAGDAEVLSSSAVPQGPYQKPGVRLRFVEVDADAKAVMTRLEQARSEPGQMLADAVGNTTGARADIRSVEAGGRDATEAALCTIVELSAPVAAAAAGGGAVPRVELPGVPRSSPKITPGGLGGVPGKSFKIPSIPAIPSRPADSGSAVPIAPERSAPASGDYTVPTEPSFREPSMPTPTPAPPAPASTATPAPAGKARNRTMLGRVPGKTPGTDSGPSAVARTDSAPHAAPPPADDGATTRMPPIALMPDLPPVPESSATTRMEPLFPEAKHTPPRTPTPAPGAARTSTPAPVPAPAPPPPPPEPVSASLNPPGRNFARTLLGVPAIDLPPKPSGQMPAASPPPAAALSTDDGWGAPEDGHVAEATERAETPPPIAADHAAAHVADDVDAAIDVDLATEEPAMELPPQPPGATLMPPTAPGTPVAPLGKGLRAGPAAPTLRTPQSMLELGHQARGPSKPLPGMPPARPPSIPGEPIPATQAPTMITGAPPVPPTAAAATTPPPLPPSAATAPTMMMMGAPATPAITSLGPPRPARDASETELVMRRDPEGTDALLAARNRRPLLIGVVAAVVVFSGIVIGVLLGSGGKKKPSKPSAPVAAPVQRADAAPTQTLDAAPERVATAPITADAAVETAPPEEVATEPEPEEAEPDEPEPSEPEPAVAAKKPAAGECAVAFTSTPSGASVSIGGKKKGSTPLSLNLPCKKSTAVFERLRYSDTKKSFTPKKGKTTKVAARLNRPTFSVKVTSTPTGATITVNGRTAGKTPATVKVTGFQATTIKVSKPGFQTRTTKVTAKKNGTVVKVPLRRGN